MRAIVWTVAVAGTLFLSTETRGAEAKEIRRTVDLAADGRLSIDTYKGSIDVSTWDRPSAEIVARVEPDEDDDPRDQAEKVRQTEVRIEGSGPAVRIRSDYERIRSHSFWLFAGDHGTLPLVRYTIRMPRAARLEVKDYKSRTTIAGLAAGLELNTYKGEVEIREMNGPVRLETYKGEVRAAYSRFATSQYETYKGDVEVSIPRQTAFSLETDLGRRGELRSDFATPERSSSRGSRRIDAAVNGGGPALRLRTYKGEFRIRSR